MGDRNRSRSPRRRSGGVGGNSRGGNKSEWRKPVDKRIFVSNLPWEAKWQDIKDLFRKEVGEVTYVELFKDESGQPRGAGVLEFDDPALAKKAIEQMHRFDFRGRKIVVKEDFDVERDKTGRIITDKDRERMARRRARSRSPSMGRGGGMDFGNTYGLSPNFLNTLGIDGPLQSRLFVYNLAYEVDEKKLKEVFRLAGKVLGVELYRDAKGKSRGMAIIVYDHPVEAVQAISMLNNQELLNRRMNVRFDKVPDDEPPRNMKKLPEGLNNIGMGLGPDGIPLWNVRANLPAELTTNQMDNPLGFGTFASTGSGPVGAAAGMDPSAVQAALATIINMAGVAGGASGRASNSMSLGGAGSSLLGSSPGLGMLGSSMSSSALDLGGSRDLSRGSSSMGLDSRAMMDRLSGGAGAGLSSSGAMDRMSMMPLMGDFGMDSGTSMLGGSSSGLGSRSMMSSMSDRMDMMDREFRSSRYGKDSLGESMKSSMSTSGNMDRVIVQNLPLDCTWQRLKDMARGAGEIKFAEIVERGTGLIRFSSERETQRAISLLNGQRYEGRTLSASIF